MATQKLEELPTSLASLPLMLFLPIRETSENLRVKAVNSKMLFKDKVMGKDFPSWILGARFLGA